MNLPAEFNFAFQSTGSERSSDLPVTRCAAPEIGESGV